MRSVFRLLKAAAMLLAFAVGPFLLVGAWYSFSLGDDQLRAALTRPSMLLQITTDGATFHICVCERTLRPEEVPDTVRKALIAIEDNGFEHHIGISLTGLARAVITAGDVGGSTLTQQLAKIAVTGNHNPSPIVRKATEIVTALRIEHLWSKREILALYLSRTNFGTVGGVAVFGLRDAARVYFARDPQDLSLGQAALLVGMLNGPSLYHPLRHPGASASRARLVLKRMAEAGFLGAPPRDPADALPGKAHRRPFRDRFVEDRLVEEFRALKLDLAPGFYRILSSIDPIAQYQARKVLRRDVERFRRRRARRAALISLDTDGRILALIGGLDYRVSTFNIATKGLRQAASTAKLATYLAALEHGWRAESTVWDDRRRLSGFVPRNYDNRYKGRLPLATCLAESRNVCTMWLARQVGTDAVAEMARRIGMIAGDAPGASIVLGAAETTLARNTAAYAALINGGRIAKPRALSAVLGDYGRMIAEPPPPLSGPVLAARQVADMRALLRGAVLHGTGHNAAFAGANAFGKTGTSQENRDAWFIGFTSDGVATGIWVGPEKRHTMRGISGGGLPALVFREYNAGMVERFHARAIGKILPR